MTTPPRPATCGDCVEYHDVLQADDRTHTTYNCSPRGTRWRLTRKPDSKACRSVHAVKITHDDGQGSLNV